MINCKLTVWCHFLQFFKIWLYIQKSVEHKKQQVGILKIVLFVAFFLIIPSYKTDTKLLKRNSFCFSTCFHSVSYSQFCHCYCFHIFQMHCSWYWEAAALWWWTLNTYTINIASSSNRTGLPLLKLKFTLAQHVTENFTLFVPYKN